MAHGLCNVQSHGRARAPLRDAPHPNPPPHSPQLLRGRRRLTGGHRCSAPFPGASSNTQGQQGSGEGTGLRCPRTSLQAAPGRVGRAFCSGRWARLREPAACGTALTVARSRLTELSLHRCKRCYKTPKTLRLASNSAVALLGSKEDQEHVTPELSSSFCLPGKPGTVTANISIPPNSPKLCPCGCLAPYHPHCSESRSPSTQGVDLNQQTHESVSSKLGTSEKTATKALPGETVVTDTFEACCTRTQQGSRAGSPLCTEGSLLYPDPNRFALTRALTAPEAHPCSPEGQRNKIC